MRTLPAWAAVIVGAAVALLGTGLLASAGVVVAGMVVEGAIQAEQARLALMWGGSAAIVAFASGGWLAGRLSDGASARRGIELGIAAAMIALLTAGLLFGIFLGPAADFHAVAVALQVTGAEDVPVGALPTSIATPPPGVGRTTDAEQVAQTRTVETLIYLGAFMLMLLSSAAAGGWTTTRERWA